MCPLICEVCIVVTAISALVYIVVCVKVMELSIPAHHAPENQVEYPLEGGIFIIRCNTL